MKNAGLHYFIVVYISLITHTPWEEGLFHIDVATHRKVDLDMTKLQTSFNALIIKLTLYC